MCAVNALVSLSVLEVTKARCQELGEEIWRIQLQMICSNKLEIALSRQNKN